MGNTNSLAIMVLKDLSCLILAENSTLDDAGRSKAKEEEYNCF
jgi:hypothetical protein